jgi:hypothetical protein
MYLDDFFLYIRVLVARYHFQLSSWEFHDFNNHIKFHDQRVRLNWIELKFNLKKNGTQIERENIEKHVL